MNTLFFHQLKTLLWKNRISGYKNKSSLIIKFAIIFFITGYIFSFLKTIATNGSKDSSDLIYTNKILKDFPNINSATLGFVLPENEAQSSFPSDVISNSIFSGVNVHSQLFKSEEELENENSSGNLIAGIIIENNYTRYTIRVNGTYIPDPEQPYIGSIVKNWEAERYASLFAPIQIAVDHAIIKNKLSGQPTTIDTRIGQLSSPVHFKNPEKSFHYCWTIIPVTLLYAIFFRDGITSIIEDKEKKTREALVSMGVHPSLYWISWALVDILICISSTIISCVLLFILNFGYFSLLLMTFILTTFYGISFIGFSLLLTAYIKQVKKAIELLNVTFSIISLASLALYFISQPFKIVISLFLSPITFQSLLRELIIIKVKYGKLDLNDFFSGRPLLYFYIFIFNIILYFVIFVALENIKAKEYMRYINLNTTFSKKLVQDEGYNEIKNNADSFSKESDLCVVEVNNVSKIYHASPFNKIFQCCCTKAACCQDKRVLQDINFKAYPNEIFAIVGHSGSGKTTLLNIMTGLIENDTGTIFYEGVDLNLIKMDLGHEFGICSKNNNLYYELTVEQNINHIAMMRKVFVECDKVLEKIGLTEYRHSTVDHLSAGQKRILSVALALMGDNRFIFLDEPTDGLDEISKKNIWNLLLEYKSKKIIFIATKNMEEVEIVADRSLVLLNGEIFCIGTTGITNSLKRQFNIMYNLKVSAYSKTFVSELVKKFVPEAIYVDSDKITTEEQFLKGDEFNHVWKLPLSASSILSDLLKEIESNTGSGKVIRNYSIYLQNLEEKFLKLEIEPEIDVEAQEDDVSDEVLLINSAHKIQNLKAGKKQASIQTIVTYLILGRFRSAIKNYKFILTAVIIPILLSLGMFMIYKFNHPDHLVRYENSITITPGSLRSNYIWNYDEKNSNIDKAIVERFIPPNDKIEFNTKEAINDIGKNTNLTNQYYISSFSANMTDAFFSFDIHYNNSMPHSLPSTINLLSNMILSLEGIDDTITLNTKPFYYYNLKGIQKDMAYIGLIFSIMMTIAVSCYGNAMVKEGKNKYIQQFYLFGVEKKIYWGSSIASATILFFMSCFIPVILGLLCFCGVFYNFSTLFLIIPILSIGSLGTIIYQYILSLVFNHKNTTRLYLFMINIFFSMIGFYFFTLINENTEKDCRDNSIFVRPSIFYEMLLTLIYPPYAIIGSLYAMFVVREYHNIGLYEQSLFNLLKFRVGIVPMMISLLAAIVLYLVIALMVEARKEKIYEASGELEKSNNNIILNSDSNVISEFLNVKNNAEAYPLSVFNLYKEHILKTFHSTLFTTYHSNEYYEKGYLSHYNPNTIVYSSPLDITFGIKPNECFGILGPKGQGKTSILDIVTSFTTQTAGKVLFYGEDNQKDKNCHGTIGYCPENSIFWEDLTVREHIDLFLRIRGYSSDDVDTFTKQLLSGYDLEIWQHKKIRHLSNENKKKLSLIFSMTDGQDKIVIDEPTSDIDPLCKKLNWEMINEAKANASILLATSSIKEAEALCDRIGIINHGRFICLGTPEQLRKKYAKNFVLSIRSSDPEAFHNKIIVEGKLFQLDYKLSKYSNNYYRYESNIIDRKEVSKIFSIMETCKSNKLIEDYNFSRKSLEQALIHISK